MKLNDIDIVNTIETSRKKLNWRKILWDNLKVFCLSMTFGIILKMNLILYGLGALATIGTMEFHKIHKLQKAKKEAKKQLDYLVKYLNENGIDVSKMSLQKAKVGTKIQYDYSKAMIQVASVTENIAVFEDNKQKLKALRQVRHDIIFYYRPQSVIDSDYTEIIDREEEAKELLLKMKK